MKESPILVISGLSGVGKTSLVDALCKEYHWCRPVLGTTTRIPRSGEVNGRHYHFMGKAEFRSRKAKGQFVEHVDLFGDSYAIGRKALEYARNGGDGLAIMILSPPGMKTIREQYPDDTYTMFVYPPSPEVLEERAGDRIKRDNAPFSGHVNLEYDYHLVNDEFKTTLHWLKLVAMATRGRRKLNILNQGIK